MSIILKLVLLMLTLGLASSWKLSPNTTPLKSLQKWALTSLVSFSFLSGSPVLADPIPLVGTPAPDFSLPSNTGKDIGLKDLAGKRTVLYFYPGDFTDGCTIEAKGFEKDIQKYNDLGVQIVGVSVDSVDKHLDFKKSYGLDFPLLSDKGGVVSGKYGSLIDLGFIGKFSNRQTYVISPESKVEYVFTDVQDHLATHSSDVLAKLASLK